MTRSVPALLSCAAAYRRDAEGLRRAVAQHLAEWRTTGSEWRLELAHRALASAERDDARAAELEREAARVERAAKEAA